jgi:MFS family permease
VERVISANPFAPIARALNEKALRPNYVALFLFGLAVAGTQAIMSLYFQRTFGFNEFITGLIFAGMGVMIALNQMFVMRAFWLKRFKEPVLELSMLVVFALGYLVLALPFVPTLIAGMITIAFGQSVLRVVMNGQIVSKASATRRGEVLGVSASLFSLAAGVAPFVSGALFSWIPFAPYLLSAALLAIAFLVLFRVRRQENEHPSPETPVVSEL